MKWLRKIDSYFLYDEVTGESAPVGDKLFYYGALGFISVMGIVFIYGLITF